MLKCFLCGAEYDETKREPVIKLLNVNSNRIIDVRAVHVNVDEPPMMLCPNCTRASIFGRQFGEITAELKPIVNVEYEPKKPVPEEPSVPVLEMPEMEEEDNG